LRQFGVDEQTIEDRERDAADEDVFEIWPDNRRALELFLACGTQWRVGPAGGVLGLDYPGVAALFRMKRVKDQDAMLTDLQVMEAAALEVLNAKK